MGLPASGALFRVVGTSTGVNDPVKARGEAASKGPLLGQTAEFPDGGRDAFVDHPFLRRFGLELARE